LYAIPVERFVDLATARAVNVWFLAVVAAWRVALFVFLTRRLGRLGWFSMLVGTLLPLVLIVTALTMLNLERAVFDIMGGLRHDAGTANDAAYAVLFTLTSLSVVAFLPLLGAWCALALVGWGRARRARGARARS
jgi:hypothetical protein